MEKVIIRPYISIIIPMYNTQEYIVRCLDSISDQTYNGRIECIIVDDCSTDDSIAIVEEYLAKNKSKVEFVLLKHKKNRKQGAARNTGIENAHGGYVLFVDSDDTIPEDAVEAMVETLAKYTEVDMVQCGMNIVGETFCYNNWTSCESWNRDVVFSDDREWIIDTCNRRIDMIPVNPVCKLISMDFIRHNGIRFVEGMFYEDIVFLVLLSKYLRRVAFCHHNLYNYFIRDSGTMRGGNVRRIASLKRMWIEIIKLTANDVYGVRRLKNIESETSYFYNRTSSPKAKRMIRSVKIYLLLHSPVKLKARILSWLICKPFMPHKNVPDDEQLEYIDF